MNKQLAGTHLWNLRRAWAGANLCRRRLAEAEANAPIIAGVVRDMRGVGGHDVDYYAWEGVRLVKIAERVLKTGLRGAPDVQTALDALDLEAPHLKRFRDAATHVEDNRTIDDVAYSGVALRFRPGGGVEYLVDPRYEHHDYLGRLFTATERALLTLADDPGSPFPRYDNTTD